MFRLLARLAQLKLVAGAHEQGLGPEQIGRVVEDFGRQKTITYKSVRRLLELDPRTRFDGIALEDERARCRARSSNNAAAEGTATLRAVLGEPTWRGLLGRPDVLDRIAEVISFREATELSGRG